MKGLILYGDSIFFGYGASDRSLGCGRLLKKNLPVPTLIKARNHITSQFALENIGNIVFRDDIHGYSHVLVLFGNNDSVLIDNDTPSVYPEDYSDNLTEIVRTIKKNGMQCCLCNLQPLNEKIFFQTQEKVCKLMRDIKSPYEWQKKYSDICIEVSKSESVPLIDIRTPLENRGDNIFFQDGMHPNDAGHYVVFETIYSQIKNL